MSAEYAARMDVLRQQREEIAARRKAIEKKLALREATAAEFSAVALQTARQKAKSLRAAAATAKVRNDEFVRAVREAQRRAEETRLLIMDERSPANVALAREKVRYLRKIEQVYPAWQEKEQKLRVEKLRALEERKRALERRRYLAKKTFEQEQTVEDLIKQTRHEIELTENLAHNEAYERELLRQQNVSHASRVDDTVREHAREARSFLHERATEQLLTIPEVDEETTDALYDTFSPRSALRALREGTSVVSIQAYDDEEKVDEPRRQINVTVPSLCEPPSRLHVPLANDAGLDPSQEYIYLDDQGQGYIYYEPQVEAAYEQHVEQAYAKQRSVRVSTETLQAPRSIPATQPPLTSTRQEQLQAETRQPLSAAPTTTDITVVLAYPATSTSGVASLSGSVLPRDSSAAATTTVVVADLAVQQRGNNPDSKTASAQEVDVSDVRRGGSNAGGDRYLQPVSDVATASVASLQTPKVQPNAASSRTQFEAAAKAEEMDDSHIQTGQQVSNAADTLPFSGSSWADDNLTTTRPRPEAVTQPATDTEETTVTSATRTLSQRAVEEKTTPPLSVHDAAGAPPSDSTSSELPRPRDEHEPPQAAVDSVIDGADMSTPATPSLDLAGSDEPKDSIELSEPPQTAVKTSQQPDQASPVPPPAPTALSDDISSDTRAGSSLIASVDSIGLSPLTSLDISGSFFRDGETKTSLLPSPPMSLSAAESVTLDVTQHPIDNPGLESELRRVSDTHPDSRQLRQVAEASNKLEASPPANAFERRSGLFSDPNSTGSGTHNDLVLKQEAPRDSTQQDDVTEERRDGPADMSAKSSSQHISAVADRPDPQRGAAIEATAGSTDNSFQSTVQAAISVANELASIPVIEPSTAITATSEEPVKKLGTQHLSPSDRVKALSALIARVEEGAAEGDQFDGAMDTGASNESKRELVRMAVGGKKAQIAFYGSDICFELILDIARDIGPALFPSKAFEGIMNDQKLRKLHQQSKDKEMELWKLLSGHLRQLVALKAIAVADLVDIFLAAFLSHDPDNQRSQRKMREFLFTTCGAAPSGSPSRKGSSATPSASPDRFDPAPSPEPAKSSLPYQEPRQQEGRVETPSLLQTAFLQHQSPPKTKTFGIGTAGYKKRLGREGDFLSSMSSTPTRLSQKLIKGDKLGDYSEFEEEEVNLQNLIGSRSSRSLGGGAVGGRSESTPAASSASFRGFSSAARRDDADFDVDF